MNLTSRLCGVKKSQTPQCLGDKAIRPLSNGVGKIVAAIGMDRLQGLAGPVPQSTVSPMLNVERPGQRPHDLLHGLQESRALSFPSIPSGRWSGEAQAGKAILIDVKGLLGTSESKRYGTPRPR